MSSYNQRVKETVEYARKASKSRFEEEIAEENSPLFTTEEIEKMNEGNAWLEANAAQVLIGIPGFRQRHGYTRADKERMKEALGHDCCNKSTKEDIEEDQLRVARLGVRKDYPAS